MAGHASSPWQTRLQPKPRCCGWTTRALARLHGKITTDKSHHQVRYQPPVQHVNTSIKYFMGQKEQQPPPGAARLFVSPQQGTDHLWQLPMSLSSSCHPMSCWRRPPLFEARPESRMLSYLIYSFQTILTGFFSLFSPISYTIHLSTCLRSATNTLRGLSSSISDQSHAHRRPHHEVTFAQLQPLFHPTHVKNRGFPEGFQGFCTQERRWLTYFSTPFLLIMRQIILMHRNLPVPPSCTSSAQHSSSWASACPSVSPRGARPHPHSRTRSSKSTPNGSLRDTAPRSRAGDPQRTSSCSPAKITVSALGWCKESVRSS